MVRRRGLRGFRAVVCSRRKAIAKRKARAYRKMGYRARVQKNPAHRCWLLLVKR